jgi:flagellar assembly factor FliW
MDFDVKAPIPGFESVTTVTLTSRDDFFMKLETRDDDTMSFTLVNPFLLREYDFEISDYYKDLLNLESAKNITVFNIMMLRRPIEESMINFSAPLIFNMDDHSVAQVLLDDAKYPQYKLLEPIANYLQEKEE